MGRKPSGDTDGLKRGAWCAEEDEVLTDYVKTHGEGQWRHVAKKAGSYSERFYFYLHNKLVFVVIIYIYNTI